LIICLVDSEQLTAFGFIINQLQRPGAVQCQRKATPGFKIR
jgi:hypothetical protein